MPKETIEVLYALMDKNGTYSKFAGTSICSMFVMNGNFLIENVIEVGAVNPNRFIDKL